MNSFERWKTMRKLKRVSATLKLTQAQLFVEREQHESFVLDAADAAGDHVTVGNAASRDEAFRATRHLERSRATLEDLTSRITLLQRTQDELLDRIGTS